MRIAIITARGGSKRIPKKNIKLFNGKPIIAYSILNALESNLFDEVMVSTDSEEIKEVAISFGAKVPFMRSEATSNDFAGTKDVLLEVINEYSKFGVSFDEFACIYPTAPLINSQILIDAYKEFSEKSASQLIPIVKFSFPPQRSFVINDDKLFLYDEKSFPMRSQDLEPLYHDSGSFYFYNTSAFLNTNKIFMDNVVPYILDELYVQDIDNIDDWKMAEIKYNIIYNIEEKRREEKRREESKLS